MGTLGNGSRLSSVFIFALCETPIIVRHCFRMFPPGLDFHSPPTPPTAQSLATVKGIFTQYLLASSDLYLLKFSKSCELSLIFVLQMGNWDLED